MRLWRYGRSIERLGQRYRLEGALGSGGSADVCLAWDEQTAREVAIKVIKPDALDQRSLDRFLKEAAQIASWHHPHILRVFGDVKFELLDASQGCLVPYIVMEYAQGGDLHKRLPPRQPLPLSEVLPVFSQICSAVSYAHTHGIIHRDIKPLNILFRVLPDGTEQAVLSDFGLAVQVDATHFTFAGGGTLPYMAPEQLQGQAQPASDLFSLGVVLYQLCTGRLPFRRTLQDLRRAGIGQMLDHPPVHPGDLNPTLPAALSEVILIALASNPDERFANADQFWEHVRQAAPLRRSNRNNTFTTGDPQNPGPTLRRNRIPSNPGIPGYPGYPASPVSPGYPTNPMRFLPEESPDFQAPGMAPQAPQPFQQAQLSGEAQEFQGSQSLQYSPHSQRSQAQNPGGATSASDKKGGEVNRVSPGITSPQTQDRRVIPYIQYTPDRETGPAPIPRRPSSSLSGIPDTGALPDLDAPGTSGPGAIYQPDASNATKSLRRARPSRPRSSEPSVFPPAITPMPPVSPTPMPSGEDTEEPPLDTGGHSSISSLSSMPSMNSAPSRPGNASPSPSGITGKPGASGAPVRRYRPRPWLQITIGLLVLLLLIGGAGALTYLLPGSPLKAVVFSSHAAIANPAAGAATVTLVPNQQDVEDVYTLQAVTGTPDPAQNQVAMRQLTYTTPTQNANATATGHNHMPGRAATGTLTFSNGAFNAQTVPAGTMFIGKDGINVVSDVTATIPSGDAATAKVGIVTIAAHTNNIGANGNIAALDINQICCINNGTIFVKNTSAFTGGRDAKDYMFLQQSDVDQVANPLKNSETTQAQNGVQAQLRANESPATSTLCKPNVTTDMPVGDNGKNVTSSNVQVSMNCTMAAYDQQAALAIIKPKLQTKANSLLGSNYGLVGNLIINTVTPHVVSQNSANLDIVVSGLWVYQFSKGTLQGLARQLAGQRLANAQVLLKQQSGVHSATIGGVNTVLPADPAMINIVVQAVHA